MTDNHSHEPRENVDVVMSRSNVSIPRRAKVTADRIRFNKDKVSVPSDYTELLGYTPRYQLHQSLESFSDKNANDMYTAQFPIHEFLFAQIIRISNRSDRSEGTTWQGGKKEKKQQVRPETARAVTKATTDNLMRLCARVKDLPYWIETDN